MKKGSLLLAGGLLLTFIITLTTWERQKLRAATSPGDSLRSEVQSLSSALFTLAAERYAANEKRGETWLLAVHNWVDSTNVLRYSDGRHSLISIPVFQDDMTGFCRYVSAYNIFNIRAADLMATAGRYRDAKEMYKLLLQFDRCGISTDELKARLECLARMENGEDVKRELDKLLQEYKGLAPFPKLSEVWTTRPVAVTNWQDVKLP